jgi:[acyl-carrier-protein] S-malonyltransferase
MARDLYDTNSIARDIIDRADGVLGSKLSWTMFEGPEEELRQTANAQPAIFLHSYVLYQLLENPRPAMAAGHSLGEYTALTVANALTFDDALRLVQLRGASMQEAGTMNPGTMAAIIGLADDIVEGICREAASATGIVQSANFNAPGQVVVSGTPEGVEEVMRRAKEAGARMAKQLNVSGAFHSPLMEPAREKLVEALAETPVHDAEFPVWANVSARAVTSADEIRSALLKQLTAPVYWTDSMRGMAAAGATEYIEVGPGTVLQGLAKRIVEGAVIRGVEKPEQVEQFNSETE